MAVHGSVTTGAGRVTAGDTDPPSHPPIRGRDMEPQQWTGRGSELQDYMSCLGLPDLSLKDG